MGIKDVKNKIAQEGVKSVSDSELIAVVFGVSLPQAEKIYAEYGSLRKLFNTRFSKLSVEKKVKADAVMEISTRYLNECVNRVAIISSAKDVRLFLKQHLRDRFNEVFMVIFLDNRHRVIHFEELFYGTIDGASVHPRKVVSRCIEHNAAAVILAHNHPSGVSEPSNSDEHITTKLRESLNMIDVRLLDHFVVGDEIVSMAERGLI